MGGKGTLAPELFRETSQAIRHAVASGVAQSAVTPGKDFLSQLGHSADVFAAFKTHSQQSAMVAALKDENGKLRSFSQFKKATEPITGKYNRAWLRTEYNTAVSRAHHAANWQQYQDEKDVLPNLEWIESTSANPGADHQIFWGVIRPVDDPFWSEHRPGDRWNCQCSLEQTDKQPTKAININPGTNDNPAPGLDGNPREPRLFNDSHPYYPKSCTSCPFATNKLAALYHNLVAGKDCDNCNAINNAITNANTITKNDAAITQAITQVVESIETLGHGNGAVIEAGLLPDVARKFCKKNKIEVGIGGMKILDSRIVHMRRASKVGRGAAISREDVINMIPNIRNAEIYYDKSHNNLLFICNSYSNDGLIKYAVAPYYEWKGKTFSTVLTAGRMHVNDLAKLIKIK